MLKRATGSWSLGEARHLMNRAGFGGSPAEVERLYGMGREGAVRFFLEPEDEGERFKLPEWVSDDAAREEGRKRMESMRKLRSGSEGRTAEELDRARREQQRAVQREAQRQGLESQGWWFQRIVKSEAPLREKMVIFWHDHFATSFQKVRQPRLMVKQNELFRNHALGSFKRLTHQVVKDPAMMLYLDLQTSRSVKPNENFARELMELFTLGEGNYGEEDVKEAARAFTGYTVDRVTGRVSHNRRNWDGGRKIIFGKEGRFEGADVVDLIFERKECSRFLVRKLWEYFVHESPEERLVEELAGVFFESGFEVMVVLREVFLSEAFYGERAMGTQIKPPVQYLVQLLRELEMDEVPLGYGVSGQQQLGQVLFMPPNVSGWDWGQAWINTNTLLARYRIAGGLLGAQAPIRSGRGGEMMMEEGMVNRRRERREGMRMRRVGPDFVKLLPMGDREDVEVLVGDLVRRFFSVDLPERAVVSFVEYARAKQEDGFTDLELGELCHLMLSTPYYQLH